MYEKVFQVRRAELHFLLQRLPPLAQAWGVTLFGTSEGGMTVHRFDDQRSPEEAAGKWLSAVACAEITLVGRVQIFKIFRGSALC